jgi:hypothetical protein
VQNPTGEPVTMEVLNSAGFTNGGLGEAQSARRLGDVTEFEKWTPACWEWPLPDLRHLQGKDPLKVEEEAYRALRDWQDSRCAMCGYN